MAIDKDERAQFVVRMPAQQHQELREYAERQDRSMSSVVRLALAKLLEEEGAALQPQRRSA